MASKIFKPPAKILVSQSIDVEIEPRGQAMRYALALIDRVHSDGKLPRIPAHTDETLDDYGFYQNDPANNTPVQIVTKPNSRHPELTCLHEIGHFLDHQALDSRGVWASHSSHHLDGWRQAVEHTKAVTDLRSRTQGPFVIHLANGSSSRVFIEQKSLDYSLVSIELFARSYAQYITTASQDNVLLVQLAGEISAVEWQAYPLQWADEDFKPVYEQFGLLFRQKGWRK